jgi:two-component system response regulator FlrC
MSGNKIILIVDDDRELREVLASTLAEPGYTVLTAADGYEAIRLLADHWVALLITDVTMPGMSGFQLALQTKLMRPQTEIIYLSAYERSSSPPSVGPWLSKPIRPAELLAEVERALV